MGFGIIRRLRGRCAFCFMADRVRGRGSRCGSRGGCGRRAGARVRDRGGGRGGRRGEVAYVVGSSVGHVGTSSSAAALVGSGALVPSSRGLLIGNMVLGQIRRSGCAN